MAQELPPVKGEAIINQANFQSTIEKEIQEISPTEALAHTKLLDSSGGIKSSTKNESMVKNAVSTLANFNQNNSSMNNNESKNL